MTSPKLQQLERKFGRSQVPQPVSPTGSGLGDAIERLLQAEVEKQVAEQMDKQPKAPRLRRMLDGFDRQPAERWTPAADTFDEPTPAIRQNVKPPKAIDVQFTRGGDDRINTVHVGDKTLKVMRDGAGRIVGMREEA